ncbi:aspartate/ornithine carbamoyltransferase family protein [Clostridium autoethanogenum]|uniref:Aspartate carbamoyltransferase n=1 Tax=Clostridium autoethanogenum DSM 10061 TaxID=1341692 RepID=A0ABN4BNK0_9CLOT|nr:aspartate carbamoyltransferase [Clostridium autoethanogenum]AGY77834.1 aspartate carbamoyltransferase [Clostridium autoethanogenum DSM 10061]ALU37968.1 Aspartate carbamoyltransferase [Clostridium autoethanogenum DSM 10061]OVY50732.1 Aspartate carbamoyltransferase catalytic chain [Clostridium autoethanogenum]
MPITKDFKTNKLSDYLEATGLKGKNFKFVDDLSKEGLLSLFKAAEVLEPYWRSKLNIMNGKVLCTMFFQPSTRTRFSTETAMIRLGGSVITESDPSHNSSVAKDESLWDTLRVVSQYANIIGLRHPDDKQVFEALPAAEVPVISCGWGNITHPTQGLLDMYTVYRAFGRFEGLRVMVTSPDLTRARSGHSFALGLARMGAEIVYSGPKNLKTPDLIKGKLNDMGAKYEEHFDLNKKEQGELITTCDLVYLPGCSVPVGQDARDVFMEKAANYYIDLETLEKAKKKTGKIIGIMHSLPRFKGEFDFRIDNTEHELYFKQISFSVAIRMALIASMIGIS